MQQIQVLIWQVFLDYYFENVFSADMKRLY